MNQLPITDETDEDEDQGLGFCECCMITFVPVGFRPGDKRCCPECQKGLPEYQL